MTVTAMTGSEFNRDVSRAKRQASEGPIVITTRGRATHVLLTIEDYAALTKEDANIVDLLAMPEAADIAFEPPRLHAGMCQPAALS